MPTNIKDYSTTQASNTTLNSISVAEGMLVELHLQLMV